ncbi:unnamed protein product [Fraxinus pennsylvanica]|uniref:Receptor-like serine/threonine-protein kinase n=1 Tax=Fraxinus pennsylvanica TaxID=56036 RepID=A0AAD2E0G4_9LAMI|nr:unnamed protein product [Fraxinus pennsylvanica]
MITQNTYFFKFSVLFVPCLLTNINFSYGADSITVNQSLSGNQSIVSSGNTFVLGFFTPGNSSRYYVGIWYENISPRTIVWVANRETPISDMNSVELKILDGNLVLMDKFHVSIWSTNVNSTTSNSVVATLGDNGNLVLRDGSEPRTSKGFWQSFDNPTDTWLPGAKLVYDKHTKTKQLLISWKNSEDPAPGLFSIELDPNGSQFIIRRNRTEQYWTSGAWNGRIFSSLPELNYVYNISYVDNENETYFTYSLYDPSSLFKSVMDISGQIRQSSWSENVKEWNLLWSQPRQQCEVYAYCGAFGTCNQNSLSSCNCLQGFKKKSETDWNLKDYSGGCVREIDLLQCENGSTYTDRKYNFLANSHASLPESSQLATVRSAGECESVCLGNCSCTAYSYYGNACSVWNGELLNFQQLSENNGSGRTIYILLSASASQFSRTKKGKAVIIGAVVGSVAVVIVLFTIVGFVIWRRQRRIRTPKVVEGSSIANLGEDNKSSISVPFCSWESILAATENFSDAHKLGQGGFGLVYKGMFPGGQEIAVKSKLLLLPIPLRSLFLQVLLFLANRSSAQGLCKDIQEVKLEQRLQMLKIFKDHSSKQCVLDDFEFYKDSHKRIQEKKAKQQLFQKQMQVWEGKPAEEKIKEDTNGDIKSKTSEVISDVVKGLQILGHVKFIYGRLAHR